MSASPSSAGGPGRAADPDLGARLLDRAPPPGYREEWTGHLAKPPSKSEVATDTALVFRAGTEWFGLPASWAGEILPARPVHSLPHRRGGALDGLVNVRGELLPCFSLERALGLAPAEGKAAASRRLVVAGAGARRLAFRADEVFGVVRYDAARRMPSPGRTALVKHLLEWNGRAVGLLEADVLWAALERSLG